MKKNLPIVLTSVIVLTLSILSLVFTSYTLSENQLSTLWILFIICGSSVLYCFIVGEVANNYSQMDKLWSILPIAYAWVITARSGMNIRMIIASVIITLWGIRLTFNFARKGAYSIKFWTGEEDYRWRIVKSNKIFSTRLRWAMFDLFFISLYQNVLILCICLPLLAGMESSLSINWIDYLAIGISVFFLLLEVIADEEQWKFQETKKKQIKERGSLDKCDSPYNLGFNTTGLWGYMRHPNYLGEQGLWVGIYIFAIASGVCVYGIFHWSIIGCLFLIFLFLGSSTLGESISSKKYPLYKEYIDRVFKYLPIRRYKNKE